MSRRSNLAPPLRTGNSSSSGFVRARPGEAGPPPTPSPFKGEVGGGGLSPAAPAPTLEDLERLALNLGAADRRLLLAKLSLANTDADAGETRDLDMWTAAVYDALLATNGGTGGGLPGPAAVKRALAASGAWSIVRGFMADAKLDVLTVTERQGVYNMLAELTVKHAHHVSMRSQAPLGPKLVANCSTNISSIFDKAFPGYVKAGLAPVIARQMARA